MHIACLVLTMTRQIDTHFMLNVDTSHAIAIERSDELEKALTDEMLARAPKAYPKWGEFSVRVFWLEDEFLANLKIIFDATEAGINPLDEEAMNAFIEATYTTDSGDEAAEGEQPQPDVAEVQDSVP